MGSVSLIGDWFIVGIATIGVFVVWYTLASLLGVDLIGEDGHTLVSVSQLIIGETVLLGMIFQSHHFLSAATESWLSQTPATISPPEKSKQ